MSRRDRITIQVEMTQDMKDKLVKFAKSRGLATSKFLLSAALSEIARQSKQ